MNDLEYAAFSAWPALEQKNLFGWCLRFANGYTKRANSANYTPGAIELTPSVVGQVEKCYEQRGLASIFRLCSFAEGDKSDACLASLGYRQIDLSTVLVCSLSESHVPIQFSIMSDAQEWLSCFESLSAQGNVSQGTHLEILRAISHPHIFAVYKVDGRPVACALGVLVDGKLGLFDVVTHVNYRNRGYATRLCTALMEWGYRNGAHQAYLQVLSVNHVAISLYQRLGFKHAYDYWYRVK